MQFSRTAIVASTAVGLTLYGPITNAVLEETIVTAQKRSESL